MQGTEKGVIRMFGSLKKLFGGEEKDEKVIAAPVSGKAVPMSQVNDPTFSQEILGKGTAVIPSEGKIVAPADGTVAQILVKAGDAVETGTAMVVLN